MKRNEKEKPGMKSQLILIEGIPGSGKTTTARFVEDWLEEQGQQTALFLEGDWAHPADYESVACLNDSQYNDLQARFPAYLEFLGQQARRENGEWFFKYRQLQHDYQELPDELIEALARYEIYSLPAEKHRQLLLRNWEKFAEQAQTEETVYVFECCFLQNPLTTLLAYHNLPEKTVRQHIWALAAAVKDLQPKIIYLNQTDVRKTLEIIRPERPQEWADLVIWYLTEQAYGQARGLSGYDGVIEFYTMRQALELELLKALPVQSVVLSDTIDWEERYKQIKEFLGSRLNCKK